MLQYKKRYSQKKLTPCWVHICLQLALCSSIKFILLLTQKQRTKNYCSHVIQLFARLTHLKWGYWWKKNYIIFIQKEATYTNICIIDNDFQHWVVSSCIQLCQIIQRRLNRTISPVCEFSWQAPVWLLSDLSAQDVFQNLKHEQIICQQLCCSWERRKHMNLLAQTSIFYL